MIVILCIGLLLAIVAAYVYLRPRRTPQRARRNRRLKHAPISTDAAGDHLAIAIGKRQRSYFLYLPRTGFEKAPLPLVLAFHGGMGSGAAFAAKTGFNEIADQHAFAVAYPNSLGLWDDGRPTTHLRQGDLDFVDGLTEHLLRNPYIDRRRVYAVGASNGGMFVMRLACERCERFAAFATALACAPVQMTQKSAFGPPVPMLIMNGTRDLFMPYWGGEIPRGQRYGAGGTVIGAEETLELWRRRNRCGQAVISTLGSKDAFGGVSVEQYVYAPRQDGKELWFVKIKGGGHDWMRASSLDMPLHPAASRARAGFDMSEMVWQFFSRHKMQGPVFGVSANEDAVRSDSAGPYLH
jgi:polyhydroxybutyrate depolymerase